MKLFRLLTLSAALGAAYPLAQAQSLVELYESARSYDASYQSAKAQYDANQFRAEQARAGLLPSASLTAGASRSLFDNSNPQVERAYGTQNAALAASQPLYRPANRITFDQSRRQLDLAEGQLAAAEQDLITRVSQAYFDVLAAQDSLAFVRALKTSVNEQLAFAKRNFEVGTSTITDTREAQARYDLATAQELAAENDLLVKRLALDTLVGRTGTQPSALAQPVRLPELQPQDVSRWVDQAEPSSPLIRQARANLDVAQLEVDKARAGHKPTVDLNASYGITRNQGGSTTLGATGRVNLATVGVTLNMPLFSGYAIQNRVKETLSLEEKARADLEATRRTVAQQTRAAYFGVLSGQGQVKALEAAEASSQSALDANRLGYQVGVRINIDVLNAQSQLFQTKRDLAQARYNLLIGSLKLRQANGTLTPQDLTRINAVLAR
ncbi:MAG: TolC family outer membrane protein [Burkholderiaceae bacterium]|nr:TolC family outer membrane protein [Burkholderiaceae bacterium]